MKTSIELSPLDQIRRAEAELARRVAAAKEAAERTVAEANSRAAQLKIDAREQGKQEGRAICQEIITNAEEEASAIISQGQRNAEEIQRKGYESMHLAVRHAVSIVINMYDDVEQR